MTGANRLLIGLAWPMVIAIVWFRTRQRSITLGPNSGLELLALLAATAYAFILPFKGNISLVDFVVLFGIFIVYVWRLTKLPSSEPHLIGPARTIGALPHGSAPRPDRRAGGIGRRLRAAGRQAIRHCPG